MSKLPETAPTAERPVYPASAELERGLDLVGLGWYNLRYCMTLLLVLLSSVMETVGTTILLPAAKCDLNISDKQRGLVFSIPYIGIFLTSYFYGYLVDTQGRRKMLIYTSLLTGCTNILAAFMPNLLTFSICKFLTSLCISVPFAIPFTFIGEIVPARYRDMLLSLVNALQTAGAILASLIAWAIIPLDFRIDVGIYTFRPWRLLAVIYSSFFILTSCLLIFGPESPKFLLSQGKPEAALKVLQIMYAAINVNSLKIFL
ncbi:unnamed protein product [Arctia plantaginis]|uniref:Major facilitator superfamily (MFS) profile domain-containing protein n=1 Tax=Arctia plantaginis TaxID=874455 RepID=A0A8S1BH67_ARCPL|nr:unnamed protein product [Arctia plantaginis]